MPSPIGPFNATVSMVGVSRAIVRLRQVVAEVGPSRLPVLIVGPTGAGKELVANMLHAASGRKGPFVAFNVCAVADPMFEDALFGHKRGAFTGALADAAGYLAEAHQGTMFLDEISGLGLASQAKLLRAIELHTFRALGATRDRSSDFRVVAASNEDLLQLADAGKFRLDLFHRLAAVTVRVPALADRREDIPLLAASFVRAVRVSEAVEIEPAAIDALKTMDWPGNVRQLKHVVEIACTLSGGYNISLVAVRAALGLGESPTIRESRYANEERELLMVLEACGWDVAAVAKQIGLHRATVYRRIAKLKLSGVKPKQR